MYNSYKMKAGKAHGFNRGRCQFERSSRRSINCHESRSPFGGRLFLFDIFCDFPIIVETPKTTWKRDDALASITSNYTVKANLTPGDWSGTVSFVCSVSEN